VAVVLLIEPSSFTVCDTVFSVTAPVSGSVSVVVVVVVTEPSSFTSVEVDVPAS